MFPASRTPSQSSLMATLEPTLVSHGSTPIFEADVADAGQAVVGTQDRTIHRCPRDVDPEGVEARVSGIKLDIEDSSISRSPSEDVILATRSITDILPAPLLAEDEDPQDTAAKPGPKIENDMCIDQYEGGELDAAITPIQVADVQEHEVEIEYERTEYAQENAPQFGGEGVYLAEEEDVMRRLSPLLSSREPPLVTCSTFDLEQQAMVSASEGIEAVVGDDFPSSIGTLVKRYTDSPLPLVKYDAKRSIHSPVNNDKDLLVVGTLVRRLSHPVPVYGAASLPASLVFSRVFFPGPERLVSTSCLSTLPSSACVFSLLVDWRVFNGVRLLLGAPNDLRRKERRLSAYTPPPVPCNMMPISSLPAQPTSLNLSANLSGNVSSAFDDCVARLAMNSSVSPRFSEVSVLWNRSLSSRSHAWRLPPRRLADKLNRDDLIRKTEDNLYSLLQGVLFCLLLSTPAVYSLCLVLYHLPLTTTRTSVVTSSIPRWTRSVVGFDGTDYISVA
ncbi:hypothetical protein C8Q73DRAFT_706387 [Cubamyces lactineus]|nr:hypothetical protein C8Q73DRAFT_706387 [Cubamyces lactineus]